MSQDPHTAWALFAALRSHPPAVWDSDRVSEYDSILTALEHTYDLDLAAFRVRRTGFQRATRRSPGRTFHSQKTYCDSGAMVRRLEGVATFLATKYPPAAETQSSKTHGF